MSRAATYHGLRCTRCGGTLRYERTTNCVECATDGVAVGQGAPPHIAARARKLGFGELEIDFLLGALPVLAPGFDLDHEFEPAGITTASGGPMEGDWQVEECTACNAFTLKSSAEDGDDFARLIAQLEVLGCEPEVRR